MTRSPSPDSRAFGPVLFAKYEGLRNDFLIVDSRPFGLEPHLPLHARIALCDRHAGVGADGILTLLPPRHASAQVRMHITNADGSIPEMCGNGVRCVSAWLADRGEVMRGEPHLIDTDGGLMRCVAREEAVCVDLPGADFAASNVGGGFRQRPVPCGDETVLGTAVSMGNPHLVLFLTSPPHAKFIAEYGPRLETWSHFPDRANIGFACLSGSSALSLVVWERGAGLTQACGTGACAAVAAFTDAGYFSPGDVVQVTLPGGPLEVCVAADGSRINMSGPARFVFEGTAPMGSLNA